MLCDAREHSRADFLAFVEGEHVVGPALTLEDSMRACLSLERPADAMERAQEASWFRRPPRAQAAKRLRASSGSGSPLSNSIGHHAERQRDGARFRLGLGIPIGENARQRGRLGDPAPVLFALDFNFQHAMLGPLAAILVNTRMRCFPAGGKGSRAGWLDLFTSEKLALASCSRDEHGLGTAGDGAGDFHFTQIRERRRGGAPLLTCAASCAETRKMSSGRDG